MRAVESATWTSGEPVSLSPRLCSAISLPLTSVSVAKPNWNYTAIRPAIPGRAPAQPSSAGLRRAGDGAVRAGSRAGPPRTWAVDHDRVRVAQRVVPWRHQLDSKPRALEVAGAGVVGLDGDRFAVCLDADPG